MKRRALFIAIIMTLMSFTSFAQPLPAQTDSMRLVKYRIDIGLDMSVPDFDSKIIDAKVMGTRLASILEYMLDNYNQSVYNRKLCLILKEQVEPLENMEFELKKIQFVNAEKSGDVITLYFTAWQDNNAAKVKQSDLVFQFKKGVSESQATNELFSMMSHYVQRREQLNE